MLKVEFYFLNFFCLFLPYFLIQGGNYLNYLVVQLSNYSICVQSYASDKVWRDQRTKPVNTYWRHQVTPEHSAIALLPVIYVPAVSNIAQLQGTTTHAQQLSNCATTKLTSKPSQQGQNPPQPQHIYIGHIYRYFMLICLLHAWWMLHMCKWMQMHALLYII